MATRGGPTGSRTNGRVRSSSGLPALHLLGRSGLRAPSLEDDRPPAARRHWTPADYGHPSCQFRVSGEPIEVRIWTRRPPAGVQAVLHPSGVWLALRTV